MVSQGIPLSEEWMQNGIREVPPCPEPSPGSIQNAPNPNPNPSPDLDPYRMHSIRVLRSLVVPLALTLINTEHANITQAQASF